MKRRHHLWWLGVIGLASLAWGTVQTWTKLHQARACAQGYEPPPAGMVSVPAGEFRMGSDDADAEPDEKPLRKVFVRAFSIDQFEVTNRRYHEFKHDHRYPAGEDDLPATFIRKNEAEAFCRWAGRRLPTGAEWEKAARGADARTYPWGNEFNAGCANINGHGAPGSNACNSPLARATGKLRGGSFPKGASPYGCQDMAGNVWEWVSDIWTDPGPFRPNTYPRGIIRGGAYNYSPRQARTSYQGFEALGTTCHDVGFRCAMDAVVVRE